MPPWPRASRPRSPPRPRPRQRRQPTTDVDATVEARMAATIAAMPTPTAAPTHTPTPTASPTPTAIPTATPTPTPVPTATPTSDPQGRVPRPRRAPQRSANAEPGRVSERHGQAGAALGGAHPNPRRRWFRRNLRDSGTQTAYIITNQHVVEGGSQVTVTVNDSNSYTGTVLGTDPTRDLAVVRHLLRQFPRPVLRQRLGAGSGRRGGDHRLRAGVDG